MALQLAHIHHLVAVLMLAICFSLHWRNKDMVWFCATEGKLVNDDSLDRLADSLIGSKEKVVDRDRAEDKTSI